MAEGWSRSIEHERHTELRVICKVLRKGVTDCVAMWSGSALLETVMRSKIPDTEVHEHSTEILL